MMIWNEEAECMDREKRDRCVQHGDVNMLPDPAPLFGSQGHQNG